MLRQLVDGLRATPPLARGARDMESLLRGAAQRWGEGRRLISRSGAYTRTCVHRDDLFEVALLNWWPGAVSAIHDHGDQHCWMMVLGGRLRVEDYVRLDPGDVRGYAHIQGSGSSVLQAGGLDSRSGRFDLHRVSATPDAPAVSLHVYAAPLHQYLIYDELSRRCETAVSTYDDVLSYAGAACK